jgi:trehalose synthase
MGRTMLTFPDIDAGYGLDDYAGNPQFARALAELREEARALVPELAGRTIVLVSAAAHGGGAEMLPRMVALLEALGVKARWAVIGAERPEFFRLTKRLQDMLYGTGTGELSAADRALFEQVGKENAAELAQSLAPEDVLVVHDPPPLVCGSLIEQAIGARAVWHCHVGLDARNAATQAAWEFLRPYVECYDHAVFSAPEYIPDYLAGRATIIHPALDPESHKNRELAPHKLVGILCNSGLTQSRHPVLTPDFESPALRLGPDGTFRPANQPEDIGLLYRPTVTQVARWDRLKGAAPLLEAFRLIKQDRLDTAALGGTRHVRRKEILRLVLAGPDPASIADDPGAGDALGELIAAYRALEPRLQQDVALLTLPMTSRKENALMVNALQRCSTVVVQNSIREGFGLTATEAMWKRCALVVSRACGLRQQVRDNVDGLTVSNPEDPVELGQAIERLLADPPLRERLARNAQRRVHRHYLIFGQLAAWMRTLVSVVGRERAPRP